ncbi:phospholipid transport system transporter-binding protein [Desulfosoma caldarium]|uniref:Anti-sigma factor antagonist n=1 Tax=Desulfosoma caldarium TaxID=610254 RepID=A0A3N1VS83_9BACT|nr:phospholipid transport system transporter-binding protein [Desulfosoma caldarium]
MAFSVTWEQDGSGRIFLQGHLNRDTVPMLRRRLFREVLNRRVARLCVNLSSVDRMDTAGLALLVELRNALARQNGELCLDGVTESVRRLIDLARLNNLLVVSD